MDRIVLCIASERPRDKYCYWRGSGKRMYVNAGEVVEQNIVEGLRKRKNNNTPKHIYKPDTLLCSMLK